MSLLADGTPHSVARSIRFATTCSVGIMLTLALQPAALAAGSPASGAPVRTPRPISARTPGAQLWVSPYNGPGSGADDATSAGASPDGTKVFVTGVSEGAGTGGDYSTVAYDAATGAQLWEARYNGPSNSGDEANALGVSLDGSKVFVTGASFGSGTGNDYATIAYDASTGEQLWVSRYDAGPLEVALALAVSPDGAQVFVTGESYGSHTSDDYATVAYDASTGGQLWVSRYDAFGLGDFAYSVALTPDGSKVIVTGESAGRMNKSDYATVAYDASTGGQLWVRRYNGPAKSTDVARSVKVSPDGTKVFVTGTSDASNGLGDYATVAYDSSTGAPLWVRRYNGPANGDDEATALGVNSGGEVFVTGYSTGPGGNWDYLTIAYKGSTGATLWLRRYDGPGHSYDQAAALGVSPDGTQVYVTGLSVGPGTGEDYATVAYDAFTGARLWLRRYNGPASQEDEAHALAVSPTGGEVLVTGMSYSPTNDWDYVTIAYAS